MLADPGISPLSHAQSRLLLAEQMTPGAAEHNLVSAFLIDGALKVDALRQALSDVQQRHTALRTVYGWDDDMNPVQRVVSQVPGNDLLEVFPPIDGDASIADKAARAVYADWWDTPFDLEARPPVRARLARLADSRHVLCYAVHHIAFDEWSAQLVQADLRLAYAARAAGRAPGWGPAPDYLAYVRWEAQHIEEWRERELPFWREALSDPPPPVLPQPHPQPAEAPMHEYTVDLTAQTVTGFITRSGQAGRFPLGIVLCAVARSLARERGTTRLALGTLFAGRVEERFRSMVGCVVNPVVIPLQLSPDRAFASELGDVTRTVLDCLGHASTPFDVLVSSLRSADRPLPWYQALVFIFAGPRAGPAPGWAAESGVTFERLSVSSPRTSLELAVEVMPRADGSWWLRGRWRGDLLSLAAGQSLIEKIAGTLRQVAGS